MMDYKYIEQLIERYWEGQTTLSEERILRDFFCQDEVPAALLCYKPLFATDAHLAEARLDATFDDRLMERIAAEGLMAEQPVVVKARRVTLRERLQPLYRAAAAVAIIVCLALAAEYPLSQPEETTYNYANYTDTYSDPQVAYHQVSDALHMLSSGLRATQSEPNDTLQSPTIKQL